MELKPRRVIGYVRVSTDEQGVSGLGLAAQREAIIAECARRGWILVDIVEDIASGKSMHRDGMTRVLAMLDAHEVDGLIAAKVDRVSRSVLDFASLLDRAKRARWTLTLLDLAVDTSTASGELMANITAVLAQHERRMISERTKAALAVKKADGVTLGRPQTLSDDVVRSIITAYAAGKGLSAIARQLMEDKVPTARGGATWHASTVQAVLKSSAAARLGVE